jgi:hypothetical protein
MRRDKGPQVPAETTVPRSAEIGNPEPNVEHHIDRCRAEIASAERSLRSGHPDIAGLCLALADWSTELRIIEGRAWKNESSSF